jgi:hypothetical protein
LLLSEGFGHEAVALGRPLFVNSLALRELAAADDKRRGSLMVGWVLAGIQDLENYWRDQAARGHDVSKGMEQIADDGVKPLAMRPPGVSPQSSGDRTRT